MRLPRTPTLLLLLAACAAPPPSEPLRTSGSRGAAGVGGVSLAPHEAVAVALTDGLCFVACGPGGVRIVDVTDPSEPAVIGSIDDLRADAVAFAEDRLFVAGVDRGLFSDRATLTVVDVIDPRAPGVRRTRSFEVDGALSLSAEGATAAVALGRAGARVVAGQALTPEDPTEALAASRAEAALARRGAVFLLGRTTDAGWLGLGEALDTLTVLRRGADGSTSRVEWTAPHAPDGARRAGLALSGDVLLAATGGELRLVDLADPAAPASLGALPLEGATAVAAGGAHGAVASRGDVVLLDLDRPERPVPAATIPTTGEVRDVALLDGLLAVADGAGGLRLYRVGRPVRTGE